MSDAKQETDNVDTSKLVLPEVHLEKVEVKTMEEEEDVVLKLRCKLFVFIKEDNYGGEVRKDYWKERGLGDVKILRHRATGKSRLLMRQEKILKICANHIIHPSTRMEPNVGSDRSWVFTAFDFSEGVLEENTYAIRFRNADQAQEFKDGYEAAGQANAQLGGGAGAGAETKAAAEPEGSVTVVSDIKEIYGEGAFLDEQCTRYAAVAQAFIARFEAAPEHFVRAPGRVNLIGEHIDYCGFSVLPMALKQDLLIVVRRVAKEEGITIANMDAQFEEGSLPADPAAAVESGSSWLRYVQAGYKGYFDAQAARAGEAEQPSFGFQAMVSGTVPVGAGLASSSATVVATFLATACTAGTLDTFAPAKVAEACAAAEQYVGTLGGGMDQAVSCLASAGSALSVSFNPLTTKEVALPEGAVFVVANSLTPSEKAASADTQFNKRVVECKLAAAVLAKQLGLDNWKELTTLKAVQSAAGLSLEDALAAATEQLQEEPYTADAISGLLGMPLAEVLQGDASSLAVLEAAADDFMLQQRARHVLSEAQRVDTFLSTCAAAGEGCLQQLGDLMNASHASCRDDFGCSCEQLDALREAALSAGALGSRLTGAGWGGSTVSLVPAALADAFIQQLAESFYSSAAGGEGQPPLAQLVFPSQPGCGAAVYRAAQ